MEENKEIVWANAVTNILNGVGWEIPYMSFQEIYFKLLEAHKEIYGENHEMQWPVSHRYLDTYILVCIFSMLKHTKEFAETRGIRDYANFKFFAGTNPQKE